MQTKTSGKARFIIVNFIRLLLLAAFIGAYFSNRWLIFTIALISFAITFLPEVLSRFCDLEVPSELELMVVLFIYGALFLGEVRGFYAEFWWWDALLNLFAAFALGFVGLTIITALQKEEKIETSPIMISILSFCLAFSFAALWEIFEFALDSLLKTILQKSLTDTMADLITALIGSAIVAFAGYFYAKSEKKNLLSGIVLKLIKKYPKFFKSKKINPEKETLDLIKKGESSTLEFKSTLRTNTHTDEIDKNIELSILKTIAAFLNTKGGVLLIGVSDEGIIQGLEKDNFQSTDKALLHLTNLIKTHLGSLAVPYINRTSIKLKEKEIIRIDCEQAEKAIFLKNAQEESFYIRNGPASAKIEGSALLDYISQRFK